MSLTGDELLLQAAENGLTRVARRALEQGADVDVEDNNGWTALHWACDTGQSEIVRLLINEEAEPNVIDSFGRAPLHLASINGHCQVVDELLRGSADFDVQDGVDGATPLHRASEANHSSFVTMLLKAGSTVNIVDNRGNTALHLASRRGHQETVRILLENGANVTITTENDESPFDSARSRNHSGVLYLLRNRALEQYDIVNGKLLRHTTFLRTIVMGLSDPESLVFMLRRGPETERALKISIAEYLGAPTTGEEVRGLYEERARLFQVLHEVKQPPAQCSRHSYHLLA